MSTEKPKRQKADWEAIERDYRTGKWSGQELADKHGNVVTRQAISKRAKEKGWTQDLSAAVRHATRASVIQAEVAKRVAGKVAGDVAGNVAESFQATTDTVLAAAEVNKQVILGHRSDIREARDVTFALLNELRTATLDPDKLQALFAKVSEDLDEVSKRILADSFRDMMRLSSRVGSVHKLADTLSKLQAMERKAFGLDDEAGGGSTGFEDLVADLPEAQG